jgi:hypothetical protein
MDRWGDTAGMLAALVTAAALAALAWPLGALWPSVLLLVPFAVPAAFRAGAAWGWRRRARRALARLPRLTLR